MRIKETNKEEGDKMKRILEITSSFTGTISTANYENSKPLFSVKEVVELDQEVMNDLDDKYIENRQKQLHDLCYNQFKQIADQLYAERIAKTYKNIRFYDGIGGKKYPSVTSIINMDKDFGIPQDELQQYASRGTIIHKQVEIFLKTGTWMMPYNIAEVSSDWLTVKNGNLGLDCSDVDFMAFYKDYPFKVISQEETVLNHEYRYGGRQDILCRIESSNPGKWAKVDKVKFDVPTILDIKTSTTLDKINGLMQQSAYAKSQPDVQQIGLIHLTKSNKCGYATPVVETNLDRYFNLFLNKLEQFRQRYGV